MSFEICVTFLAVLSFLVPSAGSAHSALLLSVLLLLFSAVLMWMLGLELLGWITVIVYVGALAVLFMFVLMLMDAPLTERVVGQRFGALPNLALWMTGWSPTLSAAVQPPVSTVTGARWVPASSEVSTLGHYLFTACPDLVILLSLVLTIGLFAIDIGAADTASKNARPVASSF